MLDDTGALVFVNDAAARLCGFDSAAEMAAVPTSEVMARFELFREDGTPFPVEELPGRRALRERPRRPLCGFVSRARARSGGRSCRPRRSSTNRGASICPSASFASSRIAVARRRPGSFWPTRARRSAPPSTIKRRSCRSPIWRSRALPTGAAIDILGPDGYARTARRGARRPGEGEPRQGVPTALAAAADRRRPTRSSASGEPRLLAEISDAMIEASTPDPEHRRLAQALGLRSAMVVPLVVGRKPWA